MIFEIIFYIFKIDILVLRGNFYYFLYLKYPCKKTFNFKIIQLKFVRIKLTIIIVLKLIRGKHLVTN
jgi:hypothetical protein